MAAAAALPFKELASAVFCLKASLGTKHGTSSYCWIRAAKCGSQLAHIHTQIFVPSLSWASILGIATVFATENLYETRD